MYKKLFSVCVFVIVATLTLAQFAAADYTLTNGTNETVWFVYTERQPRKPWEPAGWRTWGWYEIKPNATKSLDAPPDSEWVYIYVEGDESGEIKPPDHTTRESALFLIHPLKPFSVLQTAGGDFIKSNRAQRSLERAEFYKYRSGGSHTITNVLGQEVSLASRVFDKHNTTLQREDIRSVLPAVLEGLKDPDTQPLLNPETINLVVANPNLLRRFVPDIDPKFVTLLKRDAALRAVLRDPLVQKLLQEPAAIDELAGLLRIGGPMLEVTPEPNRPAQQNLPDLPAQQIYNQAINSVVWIHTGDGLGSGVLIDKARKLAVTNQHVTAGAEYVGVVFPYTQGGVKRDRNFYLGNNNIRWLMDEGYVTRGRVIRENRRNDLAIIQLAQIPTTAREIKHDFSRNAEDSMKRGDKVHILGNPGERLWNWTQGTFQRPYQVCDLADGTSLVGCLEMEADVHPGNSGGPVLNGQGMLIGILTAGTEDTTGLVSSAKSVKELLNTVPTYLPPVPPQQIYPKRVFRIRNNTGVTVPYQILWSNHDDWQSSSLETGFVRTHTSIGQNVPQGYPKIRFDHIAGDGQQVTYRTYALETAQFRENNNDNAPTYRFEYNQWGDELDLLKGAAPTVYPKRTFKIRNQTGVPILYQILWSNHDDWQSSSLETGFISTHTSGGQNVLSGYPKIRFDHIAGDGRVTYLVYNLESANANANVAPTYRFEYNQRGDRLDLYRDGFAAPILSRVTPKETTLSSNYPNPFNPETWIPYQLSEPVDVTVSIYAADGKLVRTLVLGHQPAGIYQSKTRAAYWDGRNEVGESVASGVYFYTLKAGDFTATRKMLIRK